MVIKKIKIVKMAKVGKHNTVKSELGNRWKKRAMITVEASFVIPMALMAAGIMISLCFHVYQRCWYTQAACETVLAGSTQGILKGAHGVEKANERWNILEKECYPVLQQFSSSIGGGADRINVTITGTTPVWGRAGIRVNISEAQGIVRPVKFIRKVSAFRAMKGGAG